MARGYFERHRMQVNLTASLHDWEIVVLALVECVVLILIVHFKACLIRFSDRDYILIARCLRLLSASTILVRCGL